MSRCIQVHVLCGCAQRITLSPARLPLGKTKSCAAARNWYTIVYNSKSCAVAHYTTTTPSPQPTTHHNNNNNNNNHNKPIDQADVRRFVHDSQRVNLSPVQSGESYMAYIFVQVYK